MRMAPMVAVILALSFATAPADAQRRPTADRPVRGWGGLAFAGAIPVGDYGDQVDGAFGLDGHLLYRPDPDGLFAARFDTGWFLHGWDDREVVLFSPLGGFEEVDVTSTHSAAFFSVGPEISGVVGGVRPYLGGSIGLAYFLTSITADWSQDDARVETRVQYDDIAFAFAGQGGVLIPITSGRYPISLDFGARYQGSTEADFLDDDDVDVIGGFIDLDPVTAGASIWVLRAGVSVGLDRNDRDGDRRGRRR